MNITFKYVIINLYLLQCQGGCPIQILGPFSNLIGKVHLLPFSFTFRHINNVKQNEYPENLTLQIVVLDDDNCSSVSKAKNLLIRSRLHRGLWRREGNAGLCWYSTFKFKSQLKLCGRCASGYLHPSVLQAHLESFGLRNEELART